MGVLELVGAKALPEIVKSRVVRPVAASLKQSDGVVPLVLHGTLAALATDAPSIAAREPAMMGLNKLIDLLETAG